MMVCNIITINVHGGNNDWYFIKIHLHASECILFRTFGRMWLLLNQVHR